MFGLGPDNRWMKYLVAQHRLHHSKSGTHLDPISLKHNFINAAFPSIATWFGIPKYRLSDHDFFKYSTDIKPYNDWIQKKVFSFPYGGILFNIGLYFIVTGSILISLIMPIILILVAMVVFPIIANVVTHGFGINIGYGKNYKHDDSKNIFPLGIIMLGEELHCNHHNHPSKANFAMKWYEYDFGYTLMLILEKLNLLKIKKEINYGY